MTARATVMQWPLFFFCSFREIVQYLRSSRCGNYQGGFMYFGGSFSNIYTAYCATVLVCFRGGRRQRRDVDASVVVMVVVVVVGMLGWFFVKCTALTGPSPGHYTLFATGPPYTFIGAAKISTINAHYFCLVMNHGEYKRKQKNNGINGKDIN